MFFATYFDKNYLSRGLVLYDSLKEYCKEFKLFILCLDKETNEYFQNHSDGFPQVIVVSLDEIEFFDKELHSTKDNRSRIEYYFTLSPCLPLYLLKKFHLPHICTLDADILFLDSPKPLFDYLDHHSIVITPHKFSKEIESYIKYGRFNVSFQIFKNDTTGLNCLERWRKLCIEWCGDEYDELNNRFADQKYLDEWPSLYESKLKILDDNTSGIAPWNLNNFKIINQGKEFFSNTDKMVFYHFHNFKIFSELWAANGFKNYGTKPQKSVDILYLIYWQKLAKYNKIFSISEDVSTRYKQQKNKWDKLANEKLFYFKFLNFKLYLINFQKIPRFLKNLLIKFDI